GYDARSTILESGEEEWKVRAISGPPDDKRCYGRVRKNFYLLPPLPEELEPFEAVRKAVKKAADFWEIFEITEHLRDKIAPPCTDETILVTEQRLVFPPPQHEGYLVVVDV